MLKMLAAKILHCALMLAVVFLLVLIATQSAQAQTQTVLYNFTGGIDGLNPTANLISDGAGGFFGTTLLGGSGCPGNSSGCGVVYQISPDGNGGWNETVLHSFDGAWDGANPFIAPVMLDKSGNLYSTTEFGGFGNWGVAFELSPAGGSWTETALHFFAGGRSGGHPASSLIMDVKGHLYGTTSEYLAPGGVFELSRTRTGWGYRVLYHTPTSCGLTVDPSRNIYGTTDSTVFELSRMKGGKWIPTVLHTFAGAPTDGIGPWTAPVIDAAGNLYGTTYSGGATNHGTVYELTPTRNGQGQLQWTEQIVYSFAGGTDGAMPIGQLVLDAAGNIYGTTQQGGYLNRGTVFELIPVGNGSYQEKILWTFQGIDGAGPMSGMILDGAGTLYGTAPGGGLYGAGVVFALRP